MEIPFRIIYKSQLEGMFFVHEEAPIRVSKTFIFFDGKFKNDEPNSKARYLYDPTEHQPLDFFKEKYRFKIEYTSSQKFSEGIWIVTDNYLNALKFKWIHNRSLLQRNPVKFIIGAFAIAFITVFVERSWNKLSPEQQSIQQDTIIIMQQETKPTQSQVRVDSIQKDQIKKH